MNVDHRILLGYGYLVALVLAGAVTAALGFHELGRSIGAVLAESAERLETATGRLGDDPAGPGGTRELLAESHAAIVAAQRQALASARRSAALHGLLAAVALLSLGFLTRELRTKVLDRIDELEAVARAIAAGDLHRRVRHGPPDELGLVARELNAALDARLERDCALDGLLAQERQLLVALVAAEARPSALFGLDGRVVATGLDAATTERAQEALSRVASPPPGPEEARRAEAGGEGFAFRSLAVGERVVGWLGTTSVLSSPQ